MDGVTVIIPAFNEAERIAAVLAAVRDARLVAEIIVVDDGSEDGTAGAAEASGVRVIRLPRNEGKGSAMRAGAAAAPGEVLLFLDADLCGLSADHVDALIHPVLAQRADMTIGVFRRGRTSTDWAQSLSPNISGQRCLLREFFLQAPLVEGSRSGVEIALTAHARACGLRTEVVPLEGATHVTKEEKRGLLPGVMARCRMFRDIFVTLARYHLLVRPHRRLALLS